MQSGMMPRIIGGWGQDDLHLIHSALLSVLGGGGGSLTVKDLAERIDRSVSRTSRLVEQLVARGLVVRREDPADRRVRRVQLSEQGKSFLGNIQTKRAEQILGAIACLDEEEQEIVKQAMELLAKASRRYGDGRRAEDS